MRHVAHGDPKRQDLQPRSDQRSKGAIMVLTRRTIIGGTAALAATGWPLLASAQEVTINAVHFTPAQVSYAKSFLKFADKVNQRGKGVIQIKVRGGPEVIPFTQL